MEIDQKLIKISSKFPTAKEFALGSDITILTGEVEYKLSCVKLEYTDNQDGTQNVTYIFKLIN